MASTPNKQNPSEGQKRGLPPDMILDKDNCDYISQMLREKRQAEEQGKQSKTKNSIIPKTAVPPFMKGLHQMQQMQLQLSQKQQQIQQTQPKSSSSQPPTQKQASLMPSQTTLQTPSANSVSSESSTQASQSQQSDSSSLSITSKISSEQQKIINSQIPPGTRNTTNSNNQNKQNTLRDQSSQQKQNITANNQSKLGQVIGQKNSNEQPNSDSNNNNNIESYQQESSGNVKQQDNNNNNITAKNSQEKKITQQQQQVKQEILSTTSPIQGSIQIQEEKPTQRKTIHNQQPKLFDQFFRNGNNNTYDQRRDIQESSKIQKENNTSNAITNRNNGSTQDNKNYKMINQDYFENDHHNNTTTNNNDKQLDQSTQKTTLQQPQSCSSSSSSSSWQFPSTARKYDQQQQHCEQFEESLESSFVEIHHGLGPGSNMGNVSPTAQFNSLDSSSFNISNISNIQHVSNNNLSSINNHSNIAMSYYPHQHQQNLSMSFHEHLQDQSPSQTGCYEEEPENRSSSHRQPSSNQKNNLQFLHALDSYIDYFEQTSSTQNNKNSNANLSRSYQQQQPPFQISNQNYSTNNAFLINQLEQLQQKYKESETSRGILIGDLSKAKHRYFQIKKQMQDMIDRIMELENALSLSNNRLLYTKEQLARENVELENAKFTLRQVLLNERNASSQTHGEDQFTQQQLSYYPKDLEQLSQQQNWNTRRSTLPHQVMNIDDISTFVSIPDHFSARPLQKKKIQSELPKGAVQQQLLQQQQQYQLPIYQPNQQQQQQYPSKHQQFQQPQRFSNRSSMNVSPDANNRSKIINTSNIYENGEKGLKLKQQQKQRILQQVQERDSLGIDGLDGDEQQQQQQQDDDNYIEYSTISHRIKPQSYQQFQLNQESHLDKYNNSNQENLDNLNLKSHEQISYDNGLKLSSFHTQQPQQSRNTSRTFNTNQKESNKNNNAKSNLIQQQAQVSQGIPVMSHKKTISLDEEHLYQMMRLKHFEGQLAGNNNNNSYNNSKSPYDIKSTDPISLDFEQPQVGQNLSDSNNYTPNNNNNNNKIFQNTTYNTLNQINSNGGVIYNNNSSTPQNMLSGHHGRTMSLSYSKPTNTIQQLGLNQQFYKNQNQFKNQSSQMQY